MNGDAVWSTEHAIETTVPAEAIWRLCADVLGPELGPQISSDFPEILRALVERARRG